MTSSHLRAALEDKTLRHRPLFILGTANVRGPVYLGGSPEASRCPSCGGKFAPPFYPSSDISIQFKLHPRKHNRDCRLLAMVYPDGTVRAVTVPDFVKDTDVPEFAKIRFAREW